MGRGRNRKYPKSLFGIRNIRYFYPDQATLVNIRNGKQYRDIADCVRYYTSCKCCRFGQIKSRIPEFGSDFNCWEKDFTRRTNRINNLSCTSQNLGEICPKYLSENMEKVSEDNSEIRSLLTRTFATQNKSTSCDTSVQVNPGSLDSWTQTSGITQSRTGTQTVKNKSVECQTENACVTVLLNMAPSTRVSAVDQPGDFITLSVTAIDNGFDRMYIQRGKNIEEQLSLEESVIIGNILKKALQTLSSNVEYGDSELQSRRRPDSDKRSFSSFEKQECSCATSYGDMGTDCYYYSSERWDENGLIDSRTADTTPQFNQSKRQEQHQDVIIIPFADRNVPVHFSESERIVQQAKRDFAQVRIPFLSSSDIQCFRNEDGSPIELPGERDRDGKREFLATFTKQRTDRVIVKKFDHHIHSWNGILQEARTLVHLKDTGYVPQLFGLMRPNFHGDLCLIQECVSDAITLSDILYTDTYNYMKTSKMATIICLELVAGLQAFHEKHVIINVLEPSKIVVQRKDKVKTTFTDMGLATFYGGHKFIESADFLRQLPWIAPEICNGHVTSIASDIFALGHIIAEISYYFDFPEFQDIAFLCRKEIPQERIQEADLLVLLDKMSENFCDFGTLV